MAWEVGSVTRKSRKGFKEDKNSRHNIPVSLSVLRSSYLSPTHEKGIFTPKARAKTNQICKIIELEDLAFT